jgi:hypothetical protein
MTVRWYKARFCAPVECITLRTGFMTVGRNIEEIAEFEIQVTLYTKSDFLFMCTNYTTKFYVAFFADGFLL